MSKRLNIILGVIVTIALTLCGLSFLTKQMALKTSDNKYRGFYEEAKKHDFDVVFAGSSHVIDGVYPMELWNDYGIASYNLGVHGSLVPTTYWTVRNMLDYNTPKLLVLDCGLAGEETKTNVSYSFVHQAFDAVPLSVNKVRAIYDLLNDPVMDAKIASGEAVVTEKRIPGGLLWNYSVYHGRYDELTEEDFVPAENRNRGAETKVGLAIPNKMPEYSEDLFLEKETVGIEYIRKTIELCKENNIEILLTYIPFPYTEIDIKAANTISNVANEYGVGYINFLNMNVVDFDVDMFDPDSHLNVSGARKITNYIGQYIKDNYDIPDERENPEFDSWKSDYVQYEKDLLYLLEIAKTPEECLVLANSDRYRTKMYVKSEMKIDNERYKKIIRNINIYGNIEAVVDPEMSANYVIELYDANGDTLLLRREY